MYLKMSTKCQPFFPGFNVLKVVLALRDHFVYVPSQWGTRLQCNIISHWLGTYTKWSLSSLCCLVGADDDSSLTPEVASDPWGETPGEDDSGSLGNMSMVDVPAAVEDQAHMQPFRDTLSEFEMLAKAGMCSRWGSWRTVLHINAGKLKLCRLLVLYINYIPRIRRIGGCYGFMSKPPAARNGVNAITQKPWDGLFSNLVYTLVVIVSWPD